MGLGWLLVLVGGRFDGCRIPCPLPETEPLLYAFTCGGAVCRGHGQFSLDQVPPAALGRVTVYHRAEVDEEMHIAIYELPEPFDDEGEELDSVHERSGLEVEARSDPMVRAVAEALGGLELSPEMVAWLMGLHEEFVRAMEGWRRYMDGTPPPPFGGQEWVYEGNGIWRLEGPPDWDYWRL